MSELAFYRRRIEVDGKAAVVVEMGKTGAGPLIVVVASMLVRDKSYGSLLHELARRDFHALVVEMPGCGRAAPVPEPWSMDQYARWLASFVSTLSLEVRPVLIGHSNSGPPVVLLAAERPELVGCVVLADVTGADVRFSFWQVLIGRAIDAVIEWKLTLAAFHHVLFNFVFHFRNCFKQSLLAAKFDVRDEARKLSMPTLIAWGARDHTCPPRCGELLQSLIAPAERLVFDRGSHDWLITHPAAFVAALVEFLDHAPVLHDGLSSSELK